MDSIVSIIAVICIIVFVLKKKKEASPSQSKNTSSRTLSQAKPVQSSKNYSSSAYKSKPNARSKVVKAEVNHQMLLEDRENDWLAQQLRDEHKAFKLTKDMFNLKIEHASHCDAKYVKQFHQAQCDANGVDIAKGH